MRCSFNCLGFLYRMAYECISTSSQSAIINGIDLFVRLIFGLFYEKISLLLKDIDRTNEGNGSYNSLFSVNDSSFS